MEAPSIKRAGVSKPAALLFVLLLYLGSVAAGAAAQDFWKAASYKEWTQAECARLLEDSPWARTYTLAQVHIEPLQSPRPATPGPFDSPNPNAGPVTSSTADRSREERPYIRYKVQFRSALPIRQALVRQAQIAQKYDELAAGLKESFDREAGEFLGKQFPETVVVRVAFSSNVQLYTQELIRHWRTQTDETLRNFVFLIGDKGAKFPVQRYTFVEEAGREFELVFPRTREGQPLTGEKSKSIKLEFVQPRIRDQRETRVLIEFKLDKMRLEGAPAF